MKGIKKTKADGSVYYLYTSREREWRKDNPDKVRESRKKWRLSNLKKLKECLPNLICISCGSKNKLCFHHVEEKRINVGAANNWRFDRLVEEAKRCIVLCRSCHALRHNPLGRQIGGK
jgi:hypothetical protein